MTLRNTFGQAFSTPAFRVIDGELRIVGKFGEIALNDDGSFDVWMVTPDRSPMGARKLNNLCAFVENLSREADIHRLTGEAWLSTTDPTLVRETGFQLGIKRRRRYSEATLQRLRENARNNLKGALVSEKAKPCGYTAQQVTLDRVSNSGGHCYAKE